MEREYLLQGYSQYGSVLKNDSTLQLPPFPLIWLAFLLLKLA